MENAAPQKKRKKFYQSDFLKRRALLISTFLFLAYQLVRLIRLFSDAVSYKKINQVVPEDFTMGAVTGAVIMLALAGWLFAILYRQYKNQSMLKRGNRFLLLDALLCIYGLVRAIRQLTLFLQNFELLFLVDVLAILGGLIAPAVILFLADRQRIPPGDVLLLIIGAGVMAFSALGFVMIAISIGKDYTVTHALPELAFRLGMLLCGLATLRTALKLRAELPIDVPLAAVAKPEKVKKPRREFNLHLKFLDNLPGYEGEEPDIRLFDEPEEDDDDYSPAPVYEEPDEDDALYAPAYEPPEPEPVKREEVKTPVDEQGRAACLGCGRRFPAYLGVCPHCGLDMDVPPPQAPAYEPPKPEPAPAPAPIPVPRSRTDDGRAVCAYCGRRFPKYLGVCPHCGREMVL